jgi:hypothetical protein
MAGRKPLWRSGQTDTASRYGDASIAARNEQNHRRQTIMAKTNDNIASPEENARLEHSVEGVTTRDDALDLGVPMLPGSPDEPIGPEDALGEGPTRGDYSGRIGEANYQPHQTVPVADAKPGEPNVKVIAQRANVEQGEVEGKKGGVDA